jgi:ATP-dependent DNA ligase
MSIIDSLEAVEAAAQGNARLAKLKEVDSKELREILVLATSPQITFGVKKLPAPVPSQVALCDDETWRLELLAILDELRYRSLTGNDAQARIGSFLGVCSKLQQKWTERILKQDLRINIGAKDINKALGAGTIFEFTVPLATDYAKCKPKDLQGVFHVQAKLDGARTVAYMPPHGGEVTLYSRTGKEYGNFQSIKESLQAINNTRNGDACVVLDGEVVSRVNGKIDFQALQHNLFRKNGIEVGKLEYIVFDGASQTDWEIPADTYDRRYGLMYIFFNQFKADNIKLVDTSTVTNPTPKDMLELSKKFVEQGYEGAMFRAANKPVLLKRSKDLMKVKSFVDSEAVLLGRVEGTGKYLGMLGALKCKTLEGVEFEIGSGFDDAQRQAIWDMKDLPQYVNYKYFELTTAGCPRLPIFRGFRHEDDF